MVLICRTSLKLHIREKPSGREKGREGGRKRDGGGGDGEEREEAAAVLELMSACEIRNTMHLRQNHRGKR